MPFENVFIPYGAYWSTPFVRWQGSFATQHSITFAAEVTRRALAERTIPATVFDSVFLGLTVPQKHSFYGAPWYAALIGATGVTGPMFGQACATSARVLGSAAFEIESGAQEVILAATCDRTSNGPHITYPNPLAPGGKMDAEDWVWENFNCDPYAGESMVQTAENVAQECDIGREEQDELTLIRYAQYREALKNDSAFHKRFMVTPIEVKDSSGRKTLATVTTDEGVFPTTAEGLAKLKPVLPGGIVTFGGQTHPADGNAAIVVTSRARARELSRDSGITVRVLSFGQGRARPGFMAQAVVPAARAALEQAGLTIEDIAAIKTHNPFAVNDVYFCREMSVKWDAMNNYGSSLVWGHPQGPTGARSIMELIEELVIRGGGYGLFDGCAAGDTAAAVVVRVDVA